MIRLKETFVSEFQFLFDAKKVHAKSLSCESGYLSKLANKICLKMLKCGGLICVLWMTSIVFKRDKREETTQVSSLFLCSEQRTGGLLLRRQAHFNLPHGNAARSAAFPTGSNPVTRTKREETVVVSSLFLCIRLEQPAFYHIEVPCTVWQFPRQLIRDLTESSEHDAGAGDGRQDKG